MTTPIEERVRSRLGRRYHGYRAPAEGHKFLAEAPRSHLMLTLGPPILPETDYRANLLPIRDQLQEGACTGFATAASREGALSIHGQTTLDGYLSPAYLYGRTRIAEGTFPSDSGATIADEMAVLQGYGVCPEADLPYNGNPGLGPTTQSDVDARANTIDQALYVDFGNPENVKQVLSRGMLVTIGFTVYQSFEETGKDGVVPAVRSGDAVMGGHGVLVCGHSDSKGHWIVRNQWGTDWGDHGYFYMPYGYEAFWCEAWTYRPQ